MGKNDEAKAELEKASKINKHADDALIKRVNGAGDSPTPAQPPESTVK
jgi:hypothetical protein